MNSIKDMNKFESKTRNFFTKIIDFLALIILFALLIIVSKLIYQIFVTILIDSNVMHAIDKVLFALIVLELFTILLTFLKNHHIKVQRVVEIGIISIVREVIFKVFELTFEQVIALTFFLLVLGIIYFIRKYCEVNYKSFEDVI